MAKTTILLVGSLQHSVFDAALDHTIIFSYNGDQVIGNRLTIRENATDAVVYDGELTSMRLEHLLPSNSLINGKVYNAQITVTYRKGDGTTSEDVPSDQVVFSCYATPVVTFLNVTAGQIIANASYGITIQYSQAQSDLASRYILRLYNAAHQEIWNSGEKYPAPTTSDYTTTEMISGLLNGFQYYIQCDFEGVSGMQGSTGLVGFMVQYLRPRSYSVLYLTNMPHEFSIRIRSNIKVIEGNIIGPDPVYIDDQMIDLSDGETKVYWNDFGNIDEDFQIMLEVIHHEEAYKNIVELTNSDGEPIVYIKIMVGQLYGEDGMRLYAVLYSYLGPEMYYVASNSIPLPDDMETYTVSIERQSNMYNVRIV